MLTGAVKIPRAVSLERLKALAAKIAAGVSSHTDIVIAGDKAGPKVDTVRKLGIEVWSEERFEPFLADPRL